MRLGFAITAGDMRQDKQVFLPGQIYRHSGPGLSLHVPVNKITLQTPHLHEGTVSLQHVHIAETRAYICQIGVTYI